MTRTRTEPSPHLRSIPSFAGRHFLPLMSPFSGRRCKGGGRRLQQGTIRRRRGILGSSSSRGSSRGRGDWSLAGEARLGKSRGSRGGGKYNPKMQFHRGLGFSSQSSASCFYLHLHPLIWSLSILSVGNYSKKGKN